MFSRALVVVGAASCVLAPADECVVCGRAVLVPLHFIFGRVVSRVFCVSPAKPGFCL